MKSINLFVFLSLYLSCGYIVPMESAGKDNKFFIILAQHPQLINPVQRSKDQNNELKLFFNDQLKLEFVSVQGKDVKEEKENYDKLANVIWDLNLVLDNTMIRSNPETKEFLKALGCIGGLAAYRRTEGFVIDKFRVKKEFRGTTENIGLLIMHCFLAYIFKNNSDVLVSLFAEDNADDNAQLVEHKLVLYYMRNFGFFNPPEKMNIKSLALTRKEYIDCLRSKVILIEDKFLHNPLYLKQFIMFLNENDIPYNIFSQQICRKFKNNQNNILCHCKYLKIFYFKVIVIMFFCFFNRYKSCIKNS